MCAQFLPLQGFPFPAVELLMVAPVKNQHIRIYLDVCALILRFTCLVQSST